MACNALWHCLAVLLSGRTTATPQAHTYNQRCNPKLATKGVKCMETLTVCIAPWSNMVDCTPNGKQNEYTGYEVEVFKHVMGLDQMNLGDDYEFVCVNWNILINTMTGLNQTGKPRCVMSAAGLWMSDVNAQAGVRYSVPTYTSSTRLLVNAPSVDGFQKQSFWFLDVFHKDLWLALAAFLLLLPFVMFLFDEAYKKRKRLDRNSGRQHQSHVVKYRRMKHVCTGLVSHVEQLGFPSTGASWSIKVIVFGYVCFMVVVIASYSGELTSHIILPPSVSPIEALTSLKGERVGVYWLDMESIPFREYLRRFQLQLVSLRWENKSDELDILTGLKDGCHSPRTCYTMFDRHTGPYPELMGRPGLAKPDRGALQAVMIADSFADVYYSQFCELDIVGAAHKSVNQALAFAPSNISGIPDAYIAHLNMRLLKMQAGRVLQAYQENYLGISKRSEKCDDKEKHSLELSQALGLFVFMGVVLGTAFVWECFRWLWNAKRYLRSTHITAASSPYRSVTKTFGESSCSDLDNVPNPDLHGSASRPDVPGDLILEV